MEKENAFSINIYKESGNIYLSLEKEYSSSNTDYTRSVFRGIWKDSPIIIMLSLPLSVLLSIYTIFLDILLVVYLCSFYHRRHYRHRRHHQQHLSLSANSGCTACTHSRDILSTTSSIVYHILQVIGIEVYVFTNLLGRGLVLLSSPQSSLYGLPPK